VRKYNSNENLPGGIKMKNAEQTIGNLIDKAGVSIISWGWLSQHQGNAAAHRPVLLQFQTDDFIIE
jgi:hypothetical protein